VAPVDHGGGRPEAAALPSDDWLEPVLQPHQGTEGHEPCDRGDCQEVTGSDLEDAHRQQTVLDDATGSSRETTGGHSSVVREAARRSPIVTGQLHELIQDV